MPIEIELLIWAILILGMSVVVHAAAFLASPSPDHAKLYREGVLAVFNKDKP